MNEEFIVYVWRYKLFSDFNFITTNSLEIDIFSFGDRNYDSGPDFFNAKIRIGRQLWAGNVEIHINSSDWYKHKHQNDNAYNNVILHVVYNHDMEVEVKGNILPVLELKNYISEELIENYFALSSPDKSFLFCSKTYNFKADFEYNNWIDGLFVQRLERKVASVNNQLEFSTYHWEQVLFRSISRSFGLKLNGEAFAHLSASFNFITLQKQCSDRINLEALFFGQAGFLEIEYDDDYHIKLREEYSFIKQKFSLNSINNSQFKFFRTRPSNFPTIRISQLAGLYYKQPKLFSKIIELRNVGDIKDLFKIRASKYWNTHYTFRKETKSIERKLTDKFIELIILNSIIPVRFAYFKSINNQSKLEETIEFAESLKREKNSVISEFMKFGWKLTSAKESQALLELKNYYCDNKQCLRCLIGKRVLERNSNESIS
ncbi:MAG: DUF2851 family protein [Flavobacteriales bacterium]|nr:DUF2851 family protein [Flavobacteriales bacterium]